MSSSSSSGSRNRIALICAVVAVALTGAAFAAVPLYKAFCQATGFGGAVPRAYKAPGQALDQTLTVYFDTTVRGLPWSFRALQRSQVVKVGGTNVAYFEVVNNSDQPLTGRAAYNVTPDQAGAYFRKLQCFCFSDQTIAAGQTVEMPVLYFVDPKYAQDFETKNAKEVTLSYTFYPAVDAKPAAVASAR